MTVAVCDVTFTVTLLIEFPDPEIANVVPFVQVVLPWPTSVTTTDDDTGLEGGEHVMPTGPELIVSVAVDPVDGSVTVTLPAALGAVYVRVIDVLLLIV